MKITYINHHDDVLENSNSGFFHLQEVEGSIDDLVKSALTLSQLNLHIKLSKCNNSITIAVSDKGFNRT